VKPVVLGPNQPRRFYRGGARIAALRGLPAADDHVPEDWVGSTTTFAGEEANGLSTLPDGRLLRDAVAAEPEAFLGPEHAAAFGPETRLLVKLLDAGERLPVHLHPDGAFAREHLGARNGKNEAWLILEGGTLHLGFREDVDAGALRALFDAQDAGAMLAASNELRVERGDCVFVPAGTPHAIGEGVFMVEVQEPSDLGVMLEWKGFLDEDEATMGLDVETALAAARAQALPRAELDSWIRRAGAEPNVLPPAADPFFRAEWLRGGPFEPSFAILVVVDGAGRLATEAGDLELRRGDTVLVPHAAGAGELDRSLEAIRCLPPRPGGAA
jgi:mannose-6-phosphate isomerase